MHPVFSFRFWNFHNKKYEKGDFIVEYAGDCIDFKEGVEREDKQNDRKTPANFLFFVGNIGEYFYYFYSHEDIF